MITRNALVTALKNRRVADWVVIERAQDVAIVSSARHRVDTRTRFTVVVHSDTTSGRGSARLELSAVQGSARDVVDQALALASAAVGPPWRSTPPAAPAKVQLLDETLATAPLSDVAATALAALPRTGATVTAELEVMREQVNVQTQAGLRTGWAATQLRALALVATAEVSLAVVREARRLADLDLGAAIEEATADLARLAAATSPRPGPCAVILGPDVLLHDGGLGAWNVFASHATAELERLGLVRYRLRAPITAGADLVEEPLTVTSDGALDFATRSSPLGDDGDAVRRFALIERGVAVGLGMSMREAARRKLDPNGGVRNLVVASGTWTEAPPPGRSLEIKRLRSLAVDPYTGDATLEIALAIDRDDSGEHVITGGELRLDLVDVLARARRSAKPIRRGAYLGPSAVLIDRAELLV